ncbi:MAG: hypothetical protein LBV33_03570 [Lachnospiraceae bacterium]|jgi:hypothetical protein|nr:hypothetical protein [Lachnospiraceae bacterium]
MSKRFEDEYRHMAEQEMPDLWDRIEAGLNERTNQVTPLKPSFAHRFAKNARRHLYLVAACACAIIIIPTAIIAVRTNNTGDELGNLYNSDTEMSETSVAEENYEPIAEADVAYAPSEESATEYISTEDATDESPIEETADGYNPTEAAETEYINDSTVENGTVQRDNNLFPASLEEAQSWDSESLTGTTHIPNVTVQITDLSTVETLTIYHALVIATTDQCPLRADDRITFVTGQVVDYDISVGSTYQVDLLYNPDTFYHFELSITP